jgi:putative oxidoreductase
MAARRPLDHLDRPQSYDSQIRSSQMGAAIPPTSAEDLVTSLGYLLMGGVFAFAGVDHAFRFRHVRAMLAQRGWPAPGALLAAASAVELVAGIGLAFGCARAWSALALAGFTVVASVLLLDFWRGVGPERETMRSGFTVNVGLVGGLLLAFAINV